jgi:hypothetical protein
MQWHHPQLPMAAQVVVVLISEQILVMAVLAHLDKVITEELHQIFRQTTAAAAAVVLALLAVAVRPQQAG